MKTKQAADAATDTEFAVGQTVIFLGYSQDIEDPIFGKSDSIVLVEDNGNEGYGAVLANDLAAYQADPESVEVETVLASEIASDGEMAAVESVLAEVEKQAPVAKKKLAIKKAKPVAKKASSKKTATKSKLKEAKPSVDSSAEIEPELVISKEVKSAMRGKSAIDAARKLATQSKVSDITLGGVLCKIARDRDYESILGEDGQPLYVGKEGLHEFIERDLDIRYRKARYLMATYEVVSRLGIENTRAAQIGYSKLKEVLPLLEKAHEDGDTIGIASWLDKAADTPIAELQQEVKQSKVDAGIEVKPRGVKAELTKFHFSLHNDQGKAVVSALARAKEQMEDGATDSQAFAYIVEQWTQLTD